MNLNSLHEKDLCLTCFIFALLHYQNYLRSKMLSTKVFLEQLHSRLFYNSAKFWQADVFVDFWLKGILTFWDQDTF